MPPQLYAASRMDELHRHRDVLRVSTTRLLSEARQVPLQDPQPSSTDLQEMIDGLINEDLTVVELEKLIADRLDSEAVGDRTHDTKSVQEGDRRSNQREYIPTSF
ncbi:hypothetical protein HPB50_012856 [Hyalomma asiaticum]|uniref:Uncharacterized protein n=1 Tax=Hyalomma asiaticum TaxID=266040 RepID=A0ACB7TLT3_HYAAI|nr:hypothetical protein HPB50_012856 [Hyalomma asiaticum]